MILEYLIYTMPDIHGPFIHIMGIGVNTDHARTVAKDKLFKPIERIYLIHSPDQTEKRIIAKGTKNEKTIEPIKFKKLAETASRSAVVTNPWILSTVGLGVLTFVSKNENRWIRRFRDLGVTGSSQIWLNLVCFGA